MQTVPVWFETFDLDMIYLLNPKQEVVPISDVCLSFLFEANVSIEIKWT